MWRCVPSKMLACLWIQRNTRLKHAVDKAWGSGLVACISLVWKVIYMLIASTSCFYDMLMSCFKFIKGVFQLWTGVKCTALNLTMCSWMLKIDVIHGLNILEYISPSHAHTDKHTHTHTQASPSQEQVIFLPVELVLNLPLCSSQRKQFLIRMIEWK